MTTAPYRTHQRLLAAGAALALIFTMLTVIGSYPAQAGVPTDCFTVADAGPLGGGDYLVRVDRITGNTYGIGNLGTGSVEAIAMEPGGNILYATNAAQFGWIDQTTGAFSTIGTGVGSGYNDVDSLMFDPFTGELWAADRNGADDTLFRIDKTTGLAVAGSGVTINAFVVTGYDDIDDLGISPYDGELYAINNNSTHDKLITVNRTTGAVAVVIDIEADYPFAQDMEGLTFTNDGVMYGTDGDAYPNGDIYLLNPLASDPNRVVHFTDLDVNSAAPPAGIGGDFEGIGCLTADVNTITGTVWSDTDADGVLDGGEPGESNVTVRLYRDINADGLLDGGDALVNTVDTAGDGTYSFSVAVNLPFVLDIDTGDLPSGFYMTTDNLEVATFSGYGQTDANNDFGYSPPVNLGDFVWNDYDADGVQDAGEPGLAGVTVNLMDGAGGPLGPSTITEADGSYIFGSMAPGTYSVEVVSPGAGWLRSPANQGGDDAVDSDAAASGESHAVTLAANEIDLTVDAGFFQPGTIGDFVWEDEDGDGVQDGGEPGIGGVTVRLLDGGGSEITTTVTAGDGSYSFTGLGAGDYQVDPIAPAGYSLTTGNDPDAVTLTPGATDNTADFGYYDPTTASIDIEKTPDDQVVVSGGTANFTITVTNNGSVDLVNVAVADALAPDCDNTIGALAAGASTNYPCSLTGVTADFTNSATVTGDDPLGNTVNDVDTADVTVETSNASIGDTVFYDADSNGIRDAGEPGLVGVTVRLLDVHSTVVATTTTGSGGVYLFTGLAAADYSVEIVLPSGTALTTAANPWPVTGLAVGQTYLTADFGVIGTGVIGQVIWNDTNKDGSVDAGEPGAAGVGVTATWAGIDGVLGNGDDLAFSAVTGSDGIYTIVGLPAGSYQVVVNGSTLPAGYLLTYTPDGDGDLVDNLTLAAGETVNDENFGYVVTGALPATGADLDRLVALAIALMALGSGLVFIAAPPRLATEPESDRGD